MRSRRSTATAPSSSTAPSQRRSRAASQRRLGRPPARPAGPRAPRAAPARHGAARRSARSRPPRHAARARSPRRALRGACRRGHPVARGDRRRPGGFVVSALVDALQAIGLTHTAAELDDLVALATKRRWNAHPAPRAHRRGRAARARPARPQPAHRPLPARPCFPLFSQRRLDSPRSTQLAS